MAIYHFSTKIISRTKGQSAVACAAYRSGEKLHDERYDKLQDYTKKQDVIHTEIMMPEYAPAWMQDREKLWNHIEKIETRKDARLAREFEIALPRELTPQQNTALIKDFVNEHFISRGLVTDLAIHDGVASDGGKQPHAHLMVVERELVGDGFGKKYRELNQKEILLSLRKDFANTANAHLALNGHDIQVDHRSLKEQGVDLIPQKKIGATGTFHRMASHADQLQNDRLNGERLLANPEIVLDVLTHQQSTFTHNDIARIVNRYTADGEQFLSVYEKVKALPTLVSLGMNDRKQERFTTQGMMQMESEMMGNARGLNDRNGHGLHSVSIESVAEKHQLSSEQKNILNHIVADGDLKNVVGYAGTGKSRLLGAAREMWEESGYRVLGATLSGIAAENLEGSSGIQSRTLASRMYYWEKGQELLTSKDILVIDEAGMLGTRQMAEVMEEANKHGAKIVLVGDPEQLQAIEAGAAFRGIIENTSFIELTEIRRQQVDWQREATIQFATQKTADAIAQYATHDCIHEFETKDEAKHALVGAWNDARIADASKTQIMLAYTREEVRDLNERARGLRKSLGELGEDHGVQTERGERQFAEGDRIYFLRNDRDLGVRNGTLGTILDIDRHSLTVRLDKEASEKVHTVQVSTDRYNHLDYGYAATAYKAQSVTVDRSFVSASRYMNSHSSYVAMTRHREGAELFWSKEEFKEYDNMTSMLSRDGAKDLASDYINTEYFKASFAAHRGLDTLWDTFWEKYGAEWLEKIQDTIFGWVDSSREFVETVKEQMARSLGAKESHGKIVDDEWLAKMRAIRDEAYRNNPELEKELRLERHAPSSSHELSDSKDKQHEHSISSDKPVTAKQRTHYEERYQKIMKEAGRREPRKEVNNLLERHEKSSSSQPEKSIQKNEKDREIEF